jgi:hypothetical protein
MSNSSLSKNFICSPSRLKNFKKNNSCFLPNELETISQSLNINIQNTSDKKDTIKKLSNNKCTDEACLIKIDHLQEHLKHIFKPKKPNSWYNNKKEWLSNQDIEIVLEQYNSSDFSFIGVFPINFAERINDQCVSNKICNVPRLLDQLFKEKKKCFGIVFNLDRHDQSGSHWVSMFCSIDPSSSMYGIFYYDSIAMKPRQEFINFMREVNMYILQHQKTKRKFRVQYNKVRKQFKNTECGVYSIVCIIMCLENMKKKKFKHICKSMYHDDLMNELRDILFISLI